MHVVGCLCFFKTRKKERGENLSNNAIITQNAWGICSTARDWQFWRLSEAPCSNPGWLGKIWQGVCLRIQEHAACSASVAFLLLLEHLELGSGSPIPPTTSSGWQGDCRRKAWRTTLRRSRDPGPIKDPEIRPKSWPFTEPPKLGLLLSLSELPWPKQTLCPILPLCNFSATTHRPLKARRANCTPTGTEELAIGREWRQGAEEPPRVQSPAQMTVCGYRSLLLGVWESLVHFQGKKEKKRLSPHFRQTSFAFRLWLSNTPASECWGGKVTYWI